MNGGDIGTLVNIGTISGGEDGIDNEYHTGTIGGLNNIGTITGGSSGISNSSTITGTLTNSGVISGGATGGNGIYNLGNISALDNNAGGTISGYDAILDTTAAGMGTIGALNNAGSIVGGMSAINSTGGNLGVITNTGLISGDITINNQDVTIGGGTGSTIGTITGGTFTVDSGFSVDFAGGNQFVNDPIVGDVNVNGGELNYQGAITGNLTVASGASLLASGSVDGSVEVAGDYEVDVAGDTQAGSSTALGTSGDYSYLHVTGTTNTFTVDPSAGLDLIALDGSQALGLGEKLTIVTADGGVVRNFTNRESEWCVGRWNAARGLIRCR